MILWSYVEEQMIHINIFGVNTDGNLLEH